jgi:hypothetical protein
MPMVPEATDAVVLTGEAVQLAVATPAPVRTRNTVSPTAGARRPIPGPGARFVCIVMAQACVPSIRSPKFAADCPWLPLTAVRGMATDTQKIAALWAASEGPIVPIDATAKDPVHTGVTMPLMHAAAEAAMPTPMVSDCEKAVLVAGWVSPVIRMESGTSPVFVTVAVPKVVKPGYSAAVDMVTGATANAAVPDVIVAAEAVDALELRSAYVPPAASTARQIAVATAAMALAMERIERIPPSGDDGIGSSPSASR